MTIQLVHVQEGYTELNFLAVERETSNAISIN